MKNRVGVISIIGALILFITVVIFILSHPVIFPSTIIGFAFLLYSEIVFFGGGVLIEYFSAKSSGIITRVGLGMTIGIYAIIVFISSLIFMNLHLVYYSGFIIGQSLLFVCVITVGLVISVISRNRYLRDSKILKSKAMMRTVVDELNLIKEKSNNKALVDQLIESIKYSDTSSMTDIEFKIDEAIKQLKSIVSAVPIDDRQFSKEVETIDDLIKNRNIKLNQLKQGGL